MPRYKTTHIMMLSAGLLMLFGMYLFQRIDFFQLIASLIHYRSPFNPNVVFVVNKTTRLIINDLACFVIIFAIFRDAMYLRLSFYVFLFELMVLLPLYFYLKLTFEGDSEISSPLLSQIHRLIINPMLMILLMAGFFYQRFIKKNSV